MLTIESAYKYISKDWKESFIFCLLALVAFIIPIIGQLLLMGVYLRIISNAIKKNDEIPKVFGNFGSDFVLGLKYIAFAVIMSIPFYVAFFAFGGGISAEIMSNPYADPSSLILASGLGLIISMLVLWVAYLLFIPALVCNFAKEQKFSAFFEFKKAYNMVFLKFGLYLKMIGILILYSMAISAISGILGVTVVGPLILSMMALLASGNIMGTWFSEAEK